MPKNNYLFIRRSLRRTLQARTRIQCKKDVLLPKKDVLEHKQDAPVPVTVDETAVPISRQS